MVVIRGRAAASPTPDIWDGQYGDSPPPLFTATLLESRVSLRPLRYRHQADVRTCKTSRSRSTWQNICWLGTSADVRERRREVRAVLRAGPEKFGREKDRSSGGFRSFRLQKNDVSVYNTFNWTAVNVAASIVAWEFAVTHFINTVSTLKWTYCITCNHKTWFLSWH